MMALTLVAKVASAVLTDVRVGVVAVVAVEVWADAVRGVVMADSSKMFFNCVQVFDAVVDAELAVLSTEVNLDSAESTLLLTDVIALLRELAFAVACRALPAASPKGKNNDRGNPKISCLCLSQC